MNKRIPYIKIVIVACLSVILASCGSSKILYNPKEVTDLSRKLGVDIRNDDVNMPLFAEASLWLGVKYRYAGHSRKGVDCSGLTSIIYANVYSIKLSRSSADQAKDVKEIPRSRLQTGDLVFFATNSKNKKRINHVGIYLKDDKFIHASTSRGVIVSSLNEDYYKRTWRKAGKVKK